MKRILAIAAIAAAAVVTPVLAGPGFGHGHNCGAGERMLHRMDLNGDGGISAAEAGAQREVRFLGMDGDGDGAVTEAEMIARMRARIEAKIATHAAKRFARLDENGDGRIDQAEFEQAGARRFARLDADGDGVASGEEVRAAMRRHRRGGGHDAAPAD